ncbi:MAG TPA: CocE/NonD family hydrolase [Candidatus Thermoplasmatota archaeon]|nr:CocE/NonD family hydrolase [Candidatus Thermoplasmatota archaeon]
MRLPVALVVATLALAGCIQLAPAGGPVDPAVAPATGFSGTHVFPGTYNTTEKFARVAIPGPFKLAVPEITRHASAYDGASIQIGVVRPEVPNGTKVPIVVFASPYLKSLDTIDLTKTQRRLVENLVPHGYAVAFVPVRGTADAGGCSDLMGKAERADLDQAITWLGEQPWSNGAIGMVGVSYDGSTPWEVAASGNPYLKTIVPISGVNDVWDLMYQNGTNEARGMVVLNALYYEYGFVENNVLNGRSPQHVAGGIVCPESFKGFGAAMSAFASGERDPLGYWAERNSRPGVEANYNGSIFLVQGLQDWNVDPGHSYPWVNQLEAKGLVVKHLLGQWAHAWPDSFTREGHPGRWDWAEILLRWFDYWLKGDTRVDLGPRVQVADSSGRWRSDHSWPPADATPLKLHLAPNGKLATEPPADAARIPVALDPARGGFVSGATNAVPALGPALKAGCACAVFASDPFEDGLRFAGMPRVHVTVTPSGPGGWISAHLYAVENGTEKRVGWGQLDLRFADASQTMKPVVPGQPIVARLALEPLDAVVAPGGSLKLVISQGSYGDNVYGTTPFPVVLEVGGEKSAMTLDSFERDASAFFEPPTNG